MFQQLEQRIELEAQAVTIEDRKNYPKGYLDGMLWAFDLTLKWIREMSSLLVMSGMKKGEIDG